MRLDSVRGLKQELLGDVVGSLAKPARRRGLSVAAMSIDDVPTVPRTVALGIAKGKRQSDYRLAVRVQRAQDIGAEIDRLVRRAHGEADVRYIGRITKRKKRKRVGDRTCSPEVFQRRVRPLHIGLSIGHVKITAGTLGAIVSERGGLAPLVLSNNHVLANENGAKPGDAIVQPGRFDKGRAPKDIVATLLRFVPLKPTTANAVDCAIAELREGIEFDAVTICGMPPLAGDGVAEPALPVAKVGRTTGLTHGRVTAIEVDNVVVSFDLGNLRFDGQIEIESTGRDVFSDGGDSGSLIVTKKGGKSFGVGLLFAGTDLGGSNGLGLTLANPIQAVFKALKIGLV